MKVYANAKVNLALDVLEREPNGYHQLDMIMAPVSLADELELEVNPLGFDQVFFGETPSSGADTVSSALRILREDFAIPHYTVKITKNIPEQAGLAGGSADAAAVLRFLNEQHELGLSEEELMEYGARVGADVPFCIANRPARVQGYGEKVRPLKRPFALKVLLVKPEFGISTPECFRRWDELDTFHYDIELVEEALETDNIDLLYQTMANALEEPAFELQPELRQLRERMLEQDLVRVVMSGSGSALMGFSVDEQVLEKAAERFSDQPLCQIVTVGSL